MGCCESHHMTPCGVNENINIHQISLDQIEFAYDYCMWKPFLIDEHEHRLILVNEDKNQMRVYKKHKGKFYILIHLYPNQSDEANELKKIMKKIDSIKEIS